MTLKISGIHHISSMVKHPQTNLDFYTNVLNYRLVKQTLNYDNPTHYHFYFSDQAVQTAFTTTFPMLEAQVGVIGDGQVGSVTHFIPFGQRANWQEHLASYNIAHAITRRFNQTILTFNDPDGLALELIETAQETPGDTALVPLGIGSAVLYSMHPEATLKLLCDIFGYQIVNEDAHYWKLSVHSNLGGELVLRKKRQTRGRPAIGTVHHIALAIDDDAIEAWFAMLVEAGFKPTPIKNRKYFKSIYFKETGGILFELATRGPGLTIDESFDTLGSQLQIPTHTTPQQQLALKQRIPIQVRKTDTIKTYSYRNRDEYEIYTTRQKNLDSINQLAQKEKREGLTHDERLALQAHRQAFMTNNEEAL